MLLILIFKFLLAIFNASAGNVSLRDAETLFSARQSFVGSASRRQVTSDSCRVIQRHCIISYTNISVVKIYVLF